MALAGNVEVAATMKLPFTVKVGLEPLLKVAVPVLEKEPMLMVLWLPDPSILKSNDDTPVILNVVVFTKFPFITQALAELALTVPLLVNVPHTFVVQVPVPTVMVPLLIRLS